MLNGALTDLNYEKKIVASSNRGWTEANASV
jgi:hypothetical protein